MVLDTSSTIIVAIDFGTAGTGYAWASATCKNEIFANSAWVGCPGAYVKTSSTILLNKIDKTVKAFGYDARDIYQSTEDASSLYLLFSHYKMKLHKKGGVNRTTLVTADNGVDSVPIIDLIALTLKYIADRFLNELSRSTTFAVSHDNIKWVITVPAIWDNGAKQVMLDSAKLAGLKGNVVIALEPEAASIYCRTSLSIKMDSGVKYIMVDCGGGTVDITCHQSLGDNGIRELIAPSGGDWGSTFINKSFIGFLHELFGAHVKWDELVSSPEWINILNSIEMTKMSCGSHISDASPKSLDVNIIIHSMSDPSKFQEIITSYNNSHPHKIVGKLGILKLPISLIHEFYNQQIPKIIQHVEGLVKTLGEVGYIFLVGGFSESKLLQSMIIQHFENVGVNGKQIPVKVPVRPGFAVLSGAVQFGFEPSFIVSRISPITVGIEMSETFEEDKHKGGIQVEIGTAKFCENVFDTLVTKGESVEIDSIIKRSYTPIDRNQTEVCFPLYYSEDKVDVKLTSEAKYLGCLRLEIPDQGKPNSERIVEASMQFGKTFFMVEAVYKPTGKKVFAEFNFELGEIEHIPSYKKIAPKSIDVCFLMDVTSSMWKWIKEAKEKVIEISNEIKKQYPTSKLRMSFIGYRDFVDQVMFEKFIFSEDIPAMQQFISNVKADGGGDPPENVFGAFSEATSLRWEANTRVLIHIADAACHGKRFNDYEEDDHPNGDPHGLTAEKLFEDFNKLKIDYYLLKASKSLEKMVGEFKKVYDSEQRKLVDVDLSESTAALMPTVIKCVTNSVQRL